MKRAEAASAKSAELKKRLVQDRRHADLCNPDVDLTVSKALQVRRGFRFLDKDQQRGNAEAFIDALGEQETQYQEKTREKQNASRSLRLAGEKVEAAKSAELRARQRLEEAQRALEAAQINLKRCEDASKEAVQLEMNAEADLDETTSLLEEQQEKTRAALKKDEDQNLKLEDEYLKKQIDELDDQAKRLSKEAKQVYDEAEALSREPQPPL